MSLYFSVRLFHPLLQNYSTNLNETFDICSYNNYAKNWRKKCLKNCLEKIVTNKNIFFRIRDCVFPYVQNSVFPYVQNYT